MAGSSPEQKRQRSAQANTVEARCGFCSKPLEGVPVLVCVSETGSNIKEDKFACTVCQAKSPWKATAAGPDRSDEGGARVEDRGGCVLARSWRAARNCPRFRLVRMIFRECDVDRDCRLSMQELYAFAVETGFEEGPEVWQEEYEALCRKSSVHLEHGFHEAAFASLVDEGGHCQCSDEELAEVLSRLQSAPWLRQPESLATSAPEPSQSTTKEADDALGGGSCESSADEALAQDHLDVGVAPVNVVAHEQQASAGTFEVTSKLELAEILGTDVKPELAKISGSVEPTAGVGMKSEDEKGEEQPWWRQQVERPVDSVGQQDLQGGIGSIAAGPVGTPAWPSKLLPSEPPTDPSEPPQPESIRSLAERVKAIVRGLQRDDAERQLVANCLDDLQSLVRTRLPTGSSWGVLPFGSAVNGFGALGCDLDVMVCLATEKEAAVTDPASILTRLSNSLDGFAFELREVILRARVPILKLSYKHRERELEVDISVNNWQGLRNTRLLQAYSALDSKVSELGLAIKAWAKKKQVSGAPSGFLSSYALILMVIYYLQVAVDEPRLPVLQGGACAFESDGDVQECLKPHKESFALRASLGELFQGFFEFYAKSFRWGEEVVSIRLGQRAAASRTQYQLLSRWHQSRIHIEDPFDLSRNLNDVLFFTNERRFLAALQEAAGVAPPEPVAPVASILDPFRALREQIMGRSMWPQVPPPRHVAPGAAGMHVPPYGPHGAPPWSTAPAPHRKSRTVRRLAKKVYPPGQRSEKENKGRLSKKDKAGPGVPGRS